VAHVYAVPPVIAESGAGFHTSDTIMGTDDLPASMVIVGGGYVAVEFAHIFSSLGVAVRLVEMAPRLIDTFDTPIAERFTTTTRPTGGRCGTPAGSARCTPARRRANSSAPTSWGHRPRR
jgi:pyruvate/2-oxoglutarate dehydrogenase complex dihydrolipoamide dehydrogenase (E3) component